MIKSQKTADQNFWSAKKRLLIMMKLSVFLIFLNLTAVFGSGSAQTVTLRADNISLNRAMKSIKKQTGYAYFLKGKDLAEMRRDVNISKLSLTEAMNKLLAGLPAVWELEDRTIVITSSPFKTMANLKVDIPLAEVSMPDRVITGKVTDQDGKPLEGVSVTIKGTKIGTTTDANGNYSLTVKDDAREMVFSMVGYLNAERVISMEIVNVTMQRGLEGLDEVVVVGYGTQAKVNLTGSVGTVDSKALEKRTVTNSSLALQGQISGISVRQSSGNPTGDKGTLLIRGSGTFSGAGTAPLVLIDGIEGALDNVDPDDIANISVLKDASSAAIFGSKAANGVILVQTKSGKRGKPSVRYNGFVGIQRPTMLPKMVNSWEYAEVVNRINPGTYSDDDIQKMESGTDPDFPNFNHIKYLFGSGSGILTKHNASVSGGSDDIRYMFSFDYFHNNAIIEKNSSNQYNLRLNIDGDITKKLSFGVKLAGLSGSSKEPSSSYMPGIAGIVLGAMRNSNLIPGPIGNGFYGRNETLHPEADLDSKSFLRNGNSHFYSNVQLKYELVKDLQITGQAGYTLDNTRNLQFTARYPVTPTFGVDVNSLNDVWGRSNQITLRGLLDYNKRLGNHSFHLLAGFEHLSNYFENISAFRDNFPNNEIYAIDAGSTVHGKQGGTAFRNVLESVFGRLNYNYKEKYLLEANVRYDGSSRFPSDARWGTFPSFSTGWRVSEEDFFKSNTSLSWINELKLRGSWGRLGNQSIGNYPYQSLLTLGIDYPFGNAMSPGVAVTTLPNEDITWEKTTIADVGLDLSVLNYKLNVSVDYYNKITSDILYQVSVSKMLGLTPSESNAGKVGNKGWDFNISYQNSDRKFTYGISGIFSIVHNKVLSLANVDRDVARGLFIGYPIGSTYGFVSDGLFKDDEDVAHYASQPFQQFAHPGGIKFVDLDGDGAVNAANDRKVIGQPLPITTYSLTLEAGFLGFDFYALFQGEGGRRAPVQLAQFFYPLENQSNIQRAFFDNSWTPENPNSKAEFPMIQPVAASFWNSNPVDFWFRNATFIRLKSLQFGYSLSDKLLRKSSINKVRFYLSGENLFTLTGYYKDWDPEMSTATSFYPLLKNYTFGVNVNF